MTRAETPVVPLRPTRTAVVCLLMVASSVAWRRGTLFTGSLDWVVVAKGLLGVCALLLAASGGPRTPGRPWRLGTGTWWLLVALLGSSVFGALTGGTLLASGIVGVRVLMLALTVGLLLRGASGLEVLGALVRACGAVAAVAAVTGLADGAGGRLFGGIPPLNPNELALLAGVVVLWTAWRAVLGEGELRHAVAGTAALVVVYLTGSRTGLLVVVAAVAVMALSLRRARVGLVVGGLAVAALGVVAAAVTGAVGAFLSRDGVGDSTLDSRFIAWDAAGSWAQSGWQVLFGGGLSVKKIPVAGQHWDTQLLDSSWVSALVQAGVVGLVVAVAWTGWTVAGALRAPRPHRVLAIGLLVYLGGRSVLESGLFDATPAFVLFVTVSLLVEGGSRRRLRDEAAGDAVVRPGIPRSAAASRSL